MRPWTAAAIVAAALGVSVIIGGSVLMHTKAGAAQPVPADVQAGAAVVARPAPANLLFTTVNPCRLVDTRAAGGAFSNGQTRSYAVIGSTNFPAQGGHAGGCGIPASATAIAATLTAIGPAANGFVRAWAANGIEPGATALNYPKGLNIGDGSVVPISAGSTSMKIKNYAGPTNLVIDVTGYYQPQLAGSIDEDGTLLSSTGRVISSARIEQGKYRVQFDRDLTGCALQVLPGTFNYPAAATITGVYAYVTVRGTGDGADFFDESFSITAIC